MNDYTIYLSVSLFMVDCKSEPTEEEIKDYLVDAMRTHELTAADFDIDEIQKHH